ncbi:hypothetical protein C5F49_05765 [Nitrosopumilus oxyclinae]|uniref:Uncharacterized protein n=1 Tax=Nitrosopumilus oxyclinae TaxID=1959104 RepID=A0A7D5R3J9_9ARCH|nr:hypothetical protein C5F49_05765 [Nitrosopumilus oxyclinae]
MPDESCRNCGGKLHEYSKCSQCFKSNRMICDKCSTITPEQFHSICMSYQTNPTNTVPQIKPGNYSMVVTMA